MVRRATMKRQRSAELLSTIGLLPDPVPLTAAGGLDEAPVVFRVPGNGAERIIKVAWEGPVARRIVREHAVLRGLERSLPADLLPLVSRPIGMGRAGGAVYTIQSALAGVSIRVRRDDPQVVEQAMMSAARTVATLHAATDGDDRADAAWLAAEVERPLRIVSFLVRQSLGRSPDSGALRRIAEMQRSAWSNRQRRSALTHGDLWLDNVLLGPDAGTAGIIDWESARCGPPMVDALHLVLSSRRARQRRQLGEAVADALQHPGWSVAEAVVLERMAPEVDWTGADATPALILYWLAQTRANHHRRPALTARPSWAIPNLLPVLRWG